MFQEIIGWGTPGLEASVIASLPGQPNQAVLFAYDAGRPLVIRSGKPQEVAPARRVGLFLDPFAVTEGEREVWQLFEAAVDWSVSTEAIR